MVSGGDGEMSTEIFDIATNSWWYGPDLPHAVHGASSVQYEDTFILLGGELDHEILKFDNLNYVWISLPQRLQVADRYRSPIALVPDDFISCV